MDELTAEVTDHLRRGHVLSGLLGLVDVCDSLREDTMKRFLSDSRTKPELLAYVSGIRAVESAIVFITNGVTNERK